jgi:uncharacterized protein (DUF169 family)
MLTKDLLKCPGARRSLGWTSNGDVKFLEKLKEKYGFTPQISQSLIDNVPKIPHQKIAAVTVGTYESPDILVSYLQPEAAMRFVSQLQRTTGENLAISLSSIMAVCGSVAAGSYEAGKDGHIGRDRLIMGFPTSLALNLF